MFESPWYYFVCGFLIGGVLGAYIAVFRYGTLLRNHGKKINKHIEEQSKILDEMVRTHREDRT